jgi:putative transposase
MRLAGLQGKAHRRKRAKTTNSTHDQPRAMHHLDRKFDASSPNLIWLSDITYLDTTQGWLFLCVVLDICSRRIVGWAVESSLETGFVVRALQMAVHTRKPSKSLMFHACSTRRSNFVRPSRGSKRFKACPGRVIAAITRRVKASWRR